MELTTYLFDYGTKVRYILARTISVTDWVAAGLDEASYDIGEFNWGTYLGENTAGFMISGPSGQEFIPWGAVESLGMDQRKVIDHG